MKPKQSWSRPSTAHRCTPQRSQEWTVFGPLVEIWPILPLQIGGTLTWTPWCGRWTARSVDRLSGAWTRSQKLQLEQREVLQLKNWLKSKNTTQLFEVMGQPFLPWHEISKQYNGSHSSCRESCGTRKVSGFGSPWKSRITKLSITSSPI